MKKLLWIIIVIAIIVIIALTTSKSNDNTLTNTSPIENIDEKTNNKIVKENGLVIEDVLIGSGTEAQAGDKISVHYIGTFEDGTVFDSSVARGAPFSFTLGIGQVISGWDQGFDGMKIGGQRKLTIPPALAYGPQGIPGTIPPNSTLNFEVELLGIEGK